VQGLRPALGKKQKKKLESSRATQALFLLTNYEGIVSLFLFFNKNIAGR
jgi:hypothetical protein